MQHIYLIRHGQSIGQADNTVHDEMTPLSREGRQQIETLVPFMQNLQITKMYTSPLKRAEESAEILAKALKVGYEQDNDFGEWNYHGKFEGSWDEHRIQYPQLHISSGCFDPDFKLAGGESYNEFVARVHKRAKWLAEPGSESIAVVSHFCALNIITNTILDLPIREEFCFEFANGSISKVTIKPDFPTRLTFSNRIFY